jgi:hypothetical protein
MKKAFKVIVEYDEARFWKDINEYELNSVSVEELEYISQEDTPFTYTLSNLIPWHLIRDIWFPNINALVVRIADAEKEGRLDTELKNVLEIVEKNLWIYDYRHFQNALLQAMQKFNIQVPQ